MKAKVLMASVVLLVALAGLAVVATVWLRPESVAGVPSGSLSVDGQVTVRGEPPAVLTDNELTCRGGGGFDDLREGAQVVVSDAAGKTIALGQLGAGSWKRGVGCIFLFTVADVPGGLDFYGVEVSHRGRVQYTAAQLAAPVELSIG
ncbi:hypothetical protein AB0I81_22890 [Nonomuraea sp. NPDC050404]|uniref:hypothetical protein n=1 Tax=Nonomuraea sp. NPDC050404 TaxID=3155783 RepID=UPI0033DE6C31